MAKPSISILIPCYNGEKYIDKCLQSAIDQTYDKSLYEIIVCNDGSKDNSLQILRQYEAKYPDLIKIITQENKGISFVRAALLEKAKNHYIYMIDVDDWIHKKTLEWMVEKSDDGKKDIVVSRTWRVIKKGNRYVKKIWWLTNTQCFVKTPYQYLCMNSPFAWNTLIKKECFFSNGFAYKSKINMFEDLMSLSFIFSRANTLGVCHKRTYYYLKSPSSLSDIDTMIKEKNTKKLEAVMAQFNFFLEQEKKYKFTSNLSESQYKNYLNNTIYLFIMYFVGFFFYVPFKIKWPWRQHTLPGYEEIWKKYSAEIINILDKTDFPFKCPKGVWWKRVSFFLTMGWRLKKMRKNFDKKQPE